MPHPDDYQPVLDAPVDYEAKASEAKIEATSDLEQTLEMLDMIIGFEFSDAQRVQSMSKQLRELVERLYKA